MEFVPISVRLARVGIGIRYVEFLLCPHATEDTKLKMLTTTEQLRN
jgi:hypothetical protein